MRTLDRDTVLGKAHPGRKYFAAPVSDNISRLPGGGIVCHDVAIARTGEMLYNAREVKTVRPDAMGLVRVMRDAEVVFAPETLASFEGRAVTDGHPIEDVTAENWSRLAKGFIRNVRRGEGADSDKMIADLFVMDKHLADKVLAGGLRQISNGYDSDTVEIAPGLGRTTTIVGNHTAFVPAGRCGPVCAIRDEAPMSMKFLDFLFKARNTENVEDLTALASEMEQSLQSGEPLRATRDDGTTFHLHLNGAGQQIAAVRDADPTRDAELQALKDQVAALTTANAALTAEAAKPALELVKTNDAAHASDPTTGYADFLSRAEILAPGVKMMRPTHDAATAPEKFQDGMCLCKRGALTEGLKVTKTADHIKVLLGNRTIDALSCAEVDPIFLAASEMARAANNAKVSAGTRDQKTVDDVYMPGGLDRLHREYYGKNKAE